MTSYLIDSYAWIEYFEGSEAGKKVEQILHNNECFTCSLSIAEVTIKLLKKDRNAQEAYSIITNLSRELEVNNELALDSGFLYVEKRKKLKDIGIVDVIIITQARKNLLTVVTGDKDHFKDEKNVVLI